MYLLWVYLPHIFVNQIILFFRFFQLKKELSDALLAAEHEKNNFRNEVSFVKMAFNVKQLTSGWLEFCAGHLFLSWILIGQGVFSSFVIILLYELNSIVISY